ncbi:MAG TPA: 3-isopropylmalate dehydrogenase [Synergistaceae bacterium]|nr:3-isopropylmalate dehydrogenase [Synergistaceae bacterium]
MREYVLSRLAGDGIGPEVVGEASKVMEAAGQQAGFAIRWVDYPFGAEHYLRTGEVLPEGAVREMGETDALLLGAVGDPRVKPGILERGILLHLRFHFDQYVNLRPAKSYPRVPLPIQPKSGKGLDTLVVRENTEDFYIGIGGRTERGKTSVDLATERGLFTLTGRLEGAFSGATEGAFQLGVASEPAVRRVVAYGCRAAKARGEEGIAVASKANALPQMYGFWEEVARDEANRQGIKMSVVNVDAMCYHLVRTPDLYGVIVAPNMFGDIVSDLLAGLAGGLGVAAGADIGDGLSMFEPIHGSAPDIAGTGSANPIATILTGALLLNHIGEQGAATAVERAVTEFLEQAAPKALPREFGGDGTTTAVGEAILKRL